MFYDKNLIYPDPINETSLNLDIILIVCITLKIPQRPYIKSSIITLVIDALDDI